MAVRIGILWDKEVEHGNKIPFSKESLNGTYREFSDIANEMDAEVYIANFGKYRERVLEKAYVFENGWKEVEDVELDVVYDKYKFDEETRKFKQELQMELPVINRYELEEICKDKLLTYKRFPEYVPETRKATRINVQKMLEKHEKAVVKPRYDFGGHGVKVVERPAQVEPAKDKILQAFVQSSDGFPELGIEGVHDLRVVVVSGEPLTAYFRMANEGYISNVSRGGSTKYIDLEEVPAQAMDIVNEVVVKFSEYNPSVFSVDMVFDSDGKPHVLEFNSKPAFDMHDDEEIKRRKRPAMEKLVKELVSQGSS